MYKRDIAILVLAVFSVYFALQNEGPFSFKKAWYCSLYGEEGTQVDSGQNVLPKPVIIDLNGDGSLEIVAVTHDHRLVVIRGKGVGKEGDGFAKGHLMAEVSLRPSGFHTMTGQRPAALAAGYIDRPATDLVHHARKAVIVVMTENWHVMCFDHNLAKMWKHDIHKEMHSHASIHEVAILITHHAVYDSDRGMVIVGGSMNIGSVTDEPTFFDGDAFEVEHDVEKREAEMHHRLEEPKKATTIDDETESGADTSRFFSYYAFDGGRGIERWKHVGNSFKKDMDILKDDLIPQRQYKLAAEHLAAADYGEVSCREYRESILHNLPHQWRHREDTTLVLAHFTKHKHAKGARKQELGENKKKAPAKVPCTGKKCKKDAVQKVIGKVSKKASKDGRTAQIDYRPPNAIVAHLKEGIEAIHLYTGRSICKLPLPEGGLHVDLNGDGVLDHIQVTKGEEVVLTHVHGHGRFPPCTAYAMSGVPPREPFFNQSVCLGAWQEMFAHGTAFADGRSRSESLDFAPPSMLPIPTPRGEGKFRYGQRGYALLLNNYGDLTAVSPRGVRKWTIATESRWIRPPSSFFPVQPTLKPFPLRTHSFPTAILTAGNRYASVVSEHGNILTSFSLPDDPVLPLEIVDLNGNGLSDVLLISKRMIYGYVQVQNLGGRPFGMLVLCLIVAMGTIYAAQHTGAETAKRVKRSTDRTD